MILQKLFEDPKISEIVINQFHTIWFEKDGELFLSDLHFETEHHYYLFIKEICRDLNIDISLSQPFINGQWKEFRVHIVNEHLAKQNFVISFRRIRNSTWTFEDLRQEDFMTSTELQVLQKLLTDKKNLLVVGPTGSGKTSFLGALMAALPSNQRCVILEDTDELHLPNSCSVKLLTFLQEQSLIKKVELQDLVKQSLRMRPDRLIVGEIRGTEAKDLLLALSTGHAGSMGTLHAGNANEALLRLEMLIQMGAPQWSLETIRRLIFLSLQAIISIGKTSNGKRKILSIDRIHSLESFGIITESYFMALPNSNKWEGRGSTAFPF